MGVPGHFQQLLDSTLWLPPGRRRIRQRSYNERGMGFAARAERLGGANLAKRSVAVVSVAN